MIRTTAPPPRNSTGGVAVRAPRSRGIVIQNAWEANDETTERFVNIWTRQNDDERLVTTLEILSPANKARTGDGRHLYERKQREVMASPVHLVKIDLLRGGDHVTAVSVDRLRQTAGTYDYHVCVHRFDRRGEFLVYPFALADRLPEIAVPLLPPDGDVPLDVQLVMDQAYDTGPYLTRVRYATRQPDPPLTPEQQAWAAAILREREILPASAGEGA